MRILSERLPQVHTDEIRISKNQQTHPGLSVFIRGFLVGQLFLIVRFLQSRDIDLIHLQHRVHDAFCFRGVLVCQHLG